MSQGELAGEKETFIDRLFDDPASLLTPTPSQTTRAEYERMILTGGFPVALTLEEAERGSWFRDFVGMVIDHDVVEIRKIRQRQVLPLVLRHLAARTASVVKASDVDPPSST